MRITDVLDQNKIKVFLQGTSKREVIEELAELLLDAHTEEQRAGALGELFGREATCSTGIGAGVAIPHARLESCQRLMVAFGLSREALEFDAIDQEPVRIVCLVLCPSDQPGLQLRFLARASRLLHNPELRDSLLQCSSADAVYQAFREYEDVHFG
jgi:mannitol/fructose-specific phosphotransferase system IIA component (Ntr-type)